MSIRLGPDAAEQIARKHDEASSAVQESAGSLPAAPEGGLGGAALAAIMAAVSGTANDLAVLNDVVAAQLRDVGRNYARTEDEVAQMFSRMDKELDE